MISYVLMVLEKDYRSLSSNVWYQIIAGADILLRLVYTGYYVISF